MPPVGAILVVAQNTGRPVSGPYKWRGDFRIRRRGGTLGRPPSKQAHSAPIPNICIQTSHKRLNPSLFEQTQSLPPTGGRLPLSRGRFPLSGGNGRRPKGVGMMSRRDRGDRDRCPSAHTGADEGPGFRLLSCRGGTSGPPVLQQAHSATIPNICIQTSHKGENPSLFKRGQSLPCKRDVDRRRRWRDSLSRRGPERQNPPVTA